MSDAYQTLSNVVVERNLEIERLRALANSHAAMVNRLAADRDELLAQLKDVAEYTLPRLLHMRVMAAIAKAERK